MPAPKKYENYINQPRADVRSRRLDHALHETQGGSSGLEEHYPRRFRRSGRLALVAALLVGWLLSALFAPFRTLLVVLLTALLGGSVLLNVFKEEIQSGWRSGFAWFLVGLALYAALLALVTAASE